MLDMLDYGVPILNTVGHHEEISREGGFFVGKIILDLINTSQSTKSIQQRRKRRMPFHQFVRRATDNQVLAVLLNDTKTCRRR